MPKQNIISLSVDTVTHAMLLDIATLTGKSVSTLMREALATALPLMKLDPLIAEDPDRQKARLDAAAGALKAARHLAEARRKWKPAADLVRKNKHVDPAHLAHVTRVYEAAIRADDDAKRIVNKYRR